MKKEFFTGCILFFALIIKLSAQEYPGVKELAIRRVPWLAGFADIDTRYDKNIPAPAAVMSPSWSAVAWKGERLSAQILVSPRRNIGRLSVRPGPLSDGKGHVLPASSVTAGFVRYVMTDGLNKEGSGCGIASRGQSDSSLVADGIEVDDETSVGAGTTQPVWISISVPRQAEAGIYNGRLDLFMDGRKETLHYTIRVKPYVLPLPKDWHFHLDLWQNPYSVARVYDKTDWSEGHFSAMRPLMTMLAGAGQKVITVSMIHDPWRGQTYDIYRSMIRWIKKRDGSWAYDYSIFDKWVRFMMSCGIDRQINCYTMVPWNLTFHYFDEASGRDTLLIAKTGTPAYEAHWRPMLTDFVRHLKKEGWFEKTTIAMDERPLEDMQKVIALVRSVDKELKISLAGSYHPEISGDIYDYSIASAERFGAGQLDQRIKAGLPATYYTCCVEGYPNTFTFSPPAESAWLGWYAAAQHLTGYLRWAYNCWPESPMQDSRFSSWSAGDTYLVYPGGSSIRFERLKEGIQDYEKIRILEESFRKRGQKERLEQLELLLSPFQIRALKTEPAAAMLKRAKVRLNTF